MEREKPDLFAEDGLRGPVGETFAAALRGAGGALGFEVRYPRAFAPWVDQGWRGRQLVVRWSPVGSEATTTGCRWIAIRLSTVRLGAWAGAPRPDPDQVEGTRLVIGPRRPGDGDMWTEDPVLSADLWDFASRLCPWVVADDLAEQQRWVQLHGRDDVVVWHLRAGLLDEERMTEAIALLARVADWAETNDDVLADRLDTSSGVVEVRRLERTIVLGMVVVTALVVLVPLLIAAL